MALAQVIGVAVLMSVVGMVVTLIGVGHLWNYRRMKGASPADVRRLDDEGDEVELAGTAEVHETSSRSPFTDTETLVQEWKTEEYSQSSRSGNWNTLDSGESTHPFVVETDTGDVLVQATDATPYLETTTEIRVAPDESPPPPVAEYLTNTEGVERDHDQARRYVESRLDPGGDVHVFGPVRETGLSVDLPGGVDAVVGVDDPDYGWTAGEDSLSDLVEQVRSDTDQFIVTNADETGAQRRMLRIGALWLGLGLVMLSVPVLVVLFG